MGHAWRSATSRRRLGRRVWAAIATGPGIDSWFMGATRRTRGRRFGDHRRRRFCVDRHGHRWDPPNHLAYRSDGRARFIAFEYLIEGRDQSSTVLRLVASGFPGDDWRGSSKR